MMAFVSLGSSKPQISEGFQPGRWKWADGEPTVEHLITLTEVSLDFSIFREELAQFWTQNCASYFSKDWRNGQDLRS